MSSCLDRRARPGGNDMRAWRLDIFLARRTLFKTLRTITSATVELRLKPEAKRRGVGLLEDNFLRFTSLPVEIDVVVSRFRFAIRGSVSS